jgi:hypothetical protein
MKKKGTDFFGIKGKKRKEGRCPKGKGVLERGERKREKVTAVEAQVAILRSQSDVIPKLDF